MSYTMGIDIGSTSIKAQIYDQYGNFQAGGSCPTPLSQQKLKDQTAFVWEPGSIWEGVCQSVKEAIRELGNKELIGAVAVTGFGFDGLPVSADGDALYPIISWHCNRTEKIYEEFSKRLGQKRIFEATGKPPMHFDMIYRFKWLERYAPEALEKMHKWLFIEDFINLKLCGVFATDYTMGNCTSLLRADNLLWDESLLKETGIAKEFLPDIYRSGKKLGKITHTAAEATGLSVETEVVLGGHDYDCACLAVGAVSDDVIMDITGTWEMLCFVCEKLNLSEELFQSGIYLDQHVVENRRVYMSSQVSGDMTEWFKNNLSYEELQTGEVWQKLIARARRSPVGANGCFFQPFFSGSNSPVIDKKALGAFVGLSNINTKDDMVRSVYEGLNYLFRDTIETLQEITGSCGARVVATGGATRNEFWMQNKSDVTGLFLEAADVHEATTLGAAMLAAIGTGGYKNVQEAVTSVHRAGKIYEPDKEATKKYTEYFNRIYKPLQSALKNTNHAIFDRFK